MKKIILFLFSLIIISGASIAQDKAPKGKVNKDKTAATTQDDKPVKLKKDGTPDMRHKENKAKKEEAAPAGPTKKDGTPDKRYKANKDASAAPKQK